jgi:hypothetical protein
LLQFVSISKVYQGKCPIISSIANSNKLGSQPVKTTFLQGKNFFISLTASATDNSNIQSGLFTAYLLSHHLQFKLHP